MKNLKQIAKIWVILCSFLFVQITVTHAQQNPPWWNGGLRYRTRLTLSSSTGIDAIAKINLNLDTLSQQTGNIGIINLSSFRVVNHTNNSLLTSQYVLVSQNPSVVELAFYIPGPSTNSNIYLYFDTQTPGSQIPSIPALITTSQQQYQGQLTQMIQTPRARYAYHLAGGGLASMFDVQNNDWISFNTSAGANGMYRGIPNMVHPGDIFHPGHANATTTILSEGPLFIELKSTASAGAWETIWRFYPTIAQMKVTAAPQAAKYWFLYEGTPGGSISSTGSQKDKYTISNGTTYDIDQVKEGDLPNPEWLYFHDPTLTRSLFLLHHEPDTHPDRYALQNNAMTVFGFGREGVTKFLGSNNSFTIGFVESKVHSTVDQVVNGYLSPISAITGAIETNNPQPSTSDSPRPSPRTSIIPTPRPSSSSPPQLIFDLNQDGAVDESDVGRLIQHMFDSYIADPQVDNNGKANALDFGFFRQLLVGSNPDPSPSQSPSSSPASSARPSPRVSPSASPRSSPRSTPPVSAEKVLFDTTMQFVQSDNGFHILHANGDPLPDGVPTNWKQPVDYFTGQWQYRINVLQHPTGFAGKLQLCMWNMPGFDPENCAFNIDHNGIGSFYGATTPALPGNEGGWAKIVGGDLDFLNPINYRMSMILRGPGNCVVSSKQGIPENKRCPQYWDQYKDMRFRLTVVMMPGGQTFSGWQNYVW